MYSAISYPHIETLEELDKLFSPESEQCANVVLDKLVQHLSGQSTVQQPSVVH